MDGWSLNSSSMECETLFYQLLVPNASAPAADWRNAKRRQRCGNPAFYLTARSSAAICTSCCRMVKTARLWWMGTCFYHSCYCVMLNSEFLGCCSYRYLLQCYMNELSKSNIIDWSSDLNFQRQSQTCLLECLETQSGSFESVEWAVRCNI